MKKLVFLCFLVLLFSCEKKECKECVTIYYRSAASVGEETARWIDCGDTEIIETKMPEGGYIFPHSFTTCK